MAEKTEAGITPVQAADAVLAALRLELVEIETRRIEVQATIYAMEKRRREWAAGGPEGSKEEG